MNRGVNMIKCIVDNDMVKVYYIEVKVTEKDTQGNMRTAWRKLRPSGKEANPYQYDSVADAERGIDLCYSMIKGQGKLRIVDSFGEVQKVF